MANNHKSLKAICREVGVHHLQVVEVLRRVSKYVTEEDGIVITQVIGTFYLKKMRATVKKNRGVDYQVPAREVVALRPRRFPGQPLNMLVQLIGGPSSLITGPVFKRSFEDEPFNNVKLPIVTNVTVNGTSSVWELDYDISVTGLEFENNFPTKIDYELAFILKNTSIVDSPSGASVQLFDYVTNDQQRLTEGIELREVIRGERDLNGLDSIRINIGTLVSGPISNSFFFDLLVRFSIDDME